MRRDGAKPSVWKARLAIEEAARRAADKEPHVTAWLESAQREAETFSSRCKPGESVCRLFNGEKFTWPEFNYLTQVRNLCIRISQDEQYRWPRTRKQCAEFMENLASGASRDVFVDPVAIDNIKLLITAFGDQDLKLDLLTLFDMVEYFALKHKDGGYILNEAEMLGFPVEVIAMLDKSVYAARKFVSSVL